MAALMQNWIREEFAYITRKRDCGYSGLEDRRRIQRELQLPEFNGRQCDDWILAMEDIFHFFQLEEEEKLMAAIISLDGNALEWFEWEHRRRPFYQWEELKEQVVRCFLTTPTTSWRVQPDLVQGSNTVAEQNNLMKSFSTFWKAPKVEGEFAGVKTGDWTGCLEGESKGGLFADGGGSVGGIGDLGGLFDADYAGCGGYGGGPSGLDSGCAKSQVRSGGRGGDGKVDGCGPGDVGSCSTGGASDLVDGSNNGKEEKKILDGEESKRSLTEVVCLHKKQTLEDTSKGHVVKCQEQVVSTKGKNSEPCDLQQIIDLAEEDIPASLFGCGPTQAKPHFPFKEERSLYVLTHLWPSSFSQVLKPNYHHPQLNYSLGYFARNPTHLSSTNLLEISSPPTKNRSKSNSDPTYSQPNIITQSLKPNIPTRPTDSPISTFIEPIQSSKHHSGFNFPNSPNHLSPPTSSAINTLLQTYPSTTMHMKGGENFTSEQSQLLLPKCLCSIDTEEKNATGLHYQGRNFIADYHPP